MNDKENTFIFKPEKDSKPQVNRTETDTYSSARRGVYKKEEDKISPLVYVAVGLAAVLIITIIIGIIVLNSGGNDEQNNPNGTNNPIVDGNQGEDEGDGEDEVIETVTYYGIIFDEERIYLLESENGYAIYADLYDNNGKRVESRNVRITNETDIRDNGQRISLNAFMSVVRNQGGSKNLFGSEIREEDNVVTYIAYDSRTFEEDIPEVTIPTEEPKDPVIDEPNEPNEPVIDEPVEGVVDEEGTQGDPINGI